MQPKNIAIVAAAAFFLVLATGGLFLFSLFSGGKNTSQTSPGSGSLSFPSTGVSSQSAVSNVIARQSSAALDTVQIHTKNGSVMAVQDFIKGSGVASSTYGNDFYVSYPPEATTSNALEYEIDYAPEEQSFFVAILKEPIGDIRRKAAADLESRLGVSSADTCALTAYVMTPIWVNSFYSGKNLGFPGCPEAVQLAGD